MDLEPRACYSVPYASISYKHRERADLLANRYRARHNVSGHARDIPITFSEIRKEASIIGWTLPAEFPTQPQSIDPSAVAGAAPSDAQPLVAEGGRALRTVQAMLALAFLRWSRDNPGRQGPKEENISAFYRLLKEEEGHLVEGPLPRGLSRSSVAKHLKEGLEVLKAP